MRPRRTLPAALSRPYSSHAALAPRFPGGVLIPDTNEVGTREATGPDAAGWPGRARLVLGLDLRLFFLRLSLTFPRLIFPLVVFHFPSVLPFSSCLYLISPQFVSFVTAPFSLTPLFSLVLPHFSFALSCFNCPLSHFLSISFLFLAVPFISPIDLPHFLPVSIFPLVSLLFPSVFHSFSLGISFLSRLPHFLSLSFLSLPIIFSPFPFDLPHFPLSFYFPCSIPLCHAFFPIVSLISLCLSPFPFGLPCFFPSISLILCFSPFPLSLTDFSSVILISPLNLTHFLSAFIFLSVTLSPLHFAPQFLSFFPSLPHFPLSFLFFLHSPSFSPHSSPQSPPFPLGSHFPITSLISPLCPSFLLSSLPLPAFLPPLPPLSPSQAEFYPFFSPSFK